MPAHPFDGQGSGLLPGTQWLLVILAATAAFDGVLRGPSACFYRSLDRWRRPGRYLCGFDDRAWALRACSGEPGEYGIGNLCAV